MDDEFQDLDFLNNNERDLVSSHCKELLENNSIVGFESLTCDSFNIIGNPIKSYDEKEADERFARLYEFAIQQVKPTKRIIVYRNSYSDMIKNLTKMDIQINLIEFTCIVAKIDDLLNIKYRLVSRLYSTEEKKFISNWTLLPQEIQLDLLLAYKLKTKWIRKLPKAKPLDYYDLKFLEEYSIKLLNSNDILGFESMSELQYSNIEPIFTLDRFEEQKRIKRMYSDAKRVFNPEKRIMLLKGNIEYISKPKFYEGNVIDLKCQKIDISNKYYIKYRFYSRIFSVETKQPLTEWIDVTDNINNKRVV